MINGIKTRLIASTLINSMNMNSYERPYIFELRWNKCLISQNKNNTNEENLIKKKNDMFLVC